ncbi:hypothetical protein CBM2599_B30302 [Cupriavidus taiwanensis]|nr:hypothetical protein CBM2599_B30302 [Cupriavidus taiwanensis]SOY99190.1 hypothetical protein CBM2600_B40144 [Cupriavidus taiwanensis]
MFKNELNVHKNIWGSAVSVN